MVEGATYELREFSLEDVHFRRLGSDVVALAYRVNEELTVDGERDSTWRPLTQACG
jgi:hypothetical protein